MGTAKTNPKSDATDDQEVRARLHDLFKSAGTVMLLSSDGPQIHGRPMGLLRVDDDETMYFTTDQNSEKLDEIAAHPQVSIAVQERSGYAMLQGHASISSDRALIDRLWEDSWKVWYPKGRTDPAIAIIVVSPEHATLWDQSMGRGLSYLYRYIKARVRGEAMEIKPSDHAEVFLGPHTD